MNTEEYASWVHGRQWPVAGEPAPGSPLALARAGSAGKAGAAAAFECALRAIMSEAADLLIRKHHDYGPANISRSPGGPLNGLRVRIHDKVERINNLIDSGVEPENESLRDSWVDLLNYSAIALLVLDGKWPS